MVMSESSYANFSSSINATDAETGRGSLAGHASVASSVIVRTTILLILSVLNLGGNGFTLITIRLTSRLWTKTNFILASMLVADLITGVFMFGYTPFVLFLHVFNNTCNYKVATTVLASFAKVTGYVNFYHLILISVERYIAIVYPLQYETKFTDRTLKWSLSACWVSGVLISMTFSLWLINADQRKCVLIPAHYDLVAVVLGYLPVCITMITCYGKIFAIAWSQSRRVEPAIANPAHVAPVRTSSVTAEPPAHGNDADNTVDPKHNPKQRTEPPASSAVISGTASTELVQQQQQNESRRREFKAVYLTGAIVGAFVVLWFPNMLGRVLASVGYNPVVVSYLLQAGGAIGASNFALSWAIYAAVSKKYRRAYRQMLNRIGCCCKNVALQTEHSFIV